MTADEIIAATRRWLERSVIGLNLCPFAESVYRGGRVRFHVSEQTSASGLVQDLIAELAGLHAADPLICETALLIHPWVLADFVEYNDFLDVCESTVADLGFEGELQVASFHPHYQFADGHVIAVSFVKIEHHRVGRRARPNGRPERLCQRAALLPFPVGRPRHEGRWDFVLNEFEREAKQTPAGL